MHHIPVVVPTKGPMVTEMLDLLAYRRSLSREEVSHGLPEHGVPNPMGAVDGNRHEAAA